MKDRLNLTIDGSLLEAIKAYAAGKGMSVSELVESYFRQVTKPVQRQNILDMVDQLEAPGVRAIEEMGSGGERGKAGSEEMGVAAKEVKYGV